MDRRGGEILQAGDPVTITGASSATPGFGDVPTGVNFEQVKDVESIFSLTPGQIVGIGIVALWVFITFCMLICCLYANHRDRKYEREGRLEHVGTWQDAELGMERDLDLEVKSLAFVVQPHARRPNDVPVAGTSGRARGGGGGGGSDLNPFLPVPPAATRARAPLPPSNDNRGRAAVPRMPPKMLPLPSKSQSQSQLQSQAKSKAAEKTSAAAARAAVSAQRRLGDRRWVTERDERRRDRDEEEDGRERRYRERERERGADRRGRRRERERDRSRDRGRDRRYDGEGRGRRR